MKNILICPVCKSELSLIEKQYICQNKHSFDLSKEKYVNLLLNSPASTGDDKQMVVARNNFLNKGYYKLVAEKLKEIIEEQFINESHINLIDAGCGEGYYLNYLDEHLGSKFINYYGFDISKKAVQLAAKRNSTINWFVGNAFHIPIANNSIDCLISMFAFYSAEEVGRVLKDTGIALIFRAGKEHLLELKEILYDEITLKESSHEFGNQFLVERQNLNYKIELKTNEDIENLLLMTPHYWKTKIENKNQLKSYHNLVCTIDIDIYLIKKV